MTFQAHNWSFCSFAALFVKSVSVVHSSPLFRTIRQLIDIKFIHQLTCSIADFKINHSHKIYIPLGNMEIFFYNYFSY